MPEELLGVVLFVLWIYAIFDCITAETTEHLPKTWWLFFVIFVPDIGSILWFVAGRPRGATRRHVAAGPAHTTGVPSGLPPRHLRSGPVAPDDDPSFLTSLDESARKQARLDAWEADLARREREMRATDGDAAPGQA